MSLSKKTLFTTITPLPAGVSRETVMETLHDHLEMIDLNPSHEERHRINPPPEATPEEYHCTWYQITDKVSYLPAGMYTGKVSFKACFHDLSQGLQTHVYAPLGLDIKEKWTLGGSLPGEPVQPVEIGLGVPISGLYLREDVELKCNIVLTRFVRKTLKQSLATLVARLVVKSQLQEATNTNNRLTYTPNSQFATPLSPPLSPPMSPPAHLGPGQMSFPAQNKWQQVTASSPASSPGLYKSQMAQQPPQASQLNQQQYPQQSPQQYPQQYQQQQQQHSQQSFVNELEANQQKPAVQHEQPGRVPQPSHPNYGPVELE